jgi:hypothetical protein
MSGGLAEFVTRDNALVYGGTSTFFYDMPHSDPGLFTGVEQCFEPSPVELALTMKRFHMLLRSENRNEQDQSEWDAVLQRRENAKQVGEKLDYREVYPHIVEQLESVFETWKETGVARYHMEDESLEQTL